MGCSTHAWGFSFLHIHALGLFTSLDKQNMPSSPKITHPTRVCHFICDVTLQHKMYYAHPEVSFLCTAANHPQCMWASSKVWQSQFVWCHSKTLNQDTICSIYTRHTINISITNSFCHWKLSCQLTDWNDPFPQFGTYHTLPATYHGHQSYRHSPIVPCVQGI